MTILGFAMKSASATLTKMKEAPPRCVHIYNLHLNTNTHTRENTTFIAKIIETRSYHQDVTIAKENNEIDSLQAHPNNIDAYIR